MDQDLGAVLIAVIDQETGNIALVRDPKKPAPICWKFPGGKIEQVDIVPGRPHDFELTADNAARRECQEETGIALEKLARLSTMFKHGHSLFVRAGVGDFRNLIATGDEGEEVRSFSLAEIQKMHDFLPTHRPVLANLLEYLEIASAA